MAIPDWIVIGLFFVALVGIIVWVSRMKQNNAADYFLGGKDATWIAIGASIFASNIGSEHLIGLAGSGASSGMAMAHWEIQGWMILILGWVFVPFYSRSMVYTMPEFLEKRFNKSSRTILATISLISYVLTNLGNRLLLDCSRRSGAYHSSLHRFRRHEICPLHFGAADPYPALRFANHPCARIEGTRRMG